MRTIAVEACYVTHDHAWGKWPDTGDTDYAPVLAKRWLGRYPLRDGSAVVEVTHRYLPAYLGYVLAGDLTLPEGVQFPWIDNTRPPSSSVLQAQATLLRGMARSCPLLIWDHAHQCFPAVAEHLRAWFRLTCLPHADDCPGSSDKKTFPVAHGFDVVYHQMDVWDVRTGARTADKYRALGVPYTRHLPMGPTTGLRDWVRESGFDVGLKCEDMAHGRPLGPGVADLPELWFVGHCMGPETPRGALLRALSARRGELPDAGGVAPRFYGVGFPDGPMQPRLVPDPGRVLAPYYARALAGLNAQVSSLWNSRTFDLWLTGACQLAWDPWGELPRLGFEPWRHFVPVAPTFESVAEACRILTTGPRGAAELAARAHAAACDYLTRENPTSAWADIYGDHLGRLA